ncbi:SCO1664 family protein [Nocardia stercoris]|uniref:SCO1664 family protein n=1 Tax=Nocardia stercoris TaxID=2483361 RepID=A0A3M2L9T0_9NOCA|nr:SCO1664 family protein [Nocardia stercoris]RMI33303.1 SCO1664 family protein [Nocardia stercoris]
MQSAVDDSFHTGDLSVLGRVSTASNLTLVCELPTVGDAAAQRVVYKPVRGERPLWDFPDGTLAGREVASYLVSQALGWGLIPETVLRDGPYGPGMVQRWIEITEPDPAHPDLVDLVPAGAVPPDFLEVLQAVDGSGTPVSLVHADDPRLRRMAVLDVLINNADRKGGHALDGVDGQVYGVDHGICLHSEPKLRTVLWGWAGTPVPADLLGDIERFAAALPGATADALAAHITDAEIDALAGRAKTLLEQPVLPFPNSARPIPWPPF